MQTQLLEIERNSPSSQNNDFEVVNATDNPADINSKIGLFEEEEKSEKQLKVLKETIEELKEKLDDKEIEEILSIEILKNTKETKEEPKELTHTYKDVSDIYMNIFGIQNFDQYSKFIINLSDIKDRKFIEELVRNRIRVPCLKQVKLDYFTKEDHLINDFFEYCFPEEVKLLCLNWEFNTSEIQLNFYFEKIKSIIQNVTKEITLRGFSLNKVEFEEIINNTKAPRLILDWSKFDTSYVLNLENDCITHLSFQWSNYNSLNNWTDDESKCRNIFTAIANSGLKESLQKINISWCGLTFEQIKQIAISSNLNFGVLVDIIEWQPLTD
mmetsp:Transcript_14811/g.13016  ORF Transcript_14811/g.13016 Transcript_14811/m.13016 type:complete len:327 (+) Transcript_14811:503-1483(+)